MNWAGVWTGSHGNQGGDNCQKYDKRMPQAAEMYLEKEFTTKPQISSDQLPSTVICTYFKGNYWI